MRFCGPEALSDSDEQTRDTTLRTLLLLRARFATTRTVERLVSSPTSRRRERRAKRRTPSRIGIEEQAEHGDHL